MAWITDDGVYVCDDCRAKHPDRGDERYDGPVEECSVCDEIPGMKPGAIVTGRFYSDGRFGLGVVVARGRELWTRVDSGYVPVRVTQGDRINGGYRPEDLTVLDVAKAAA